MPGDVYLFDWIEKEIKKTGDVQDHKTNVKAYMTHWSMNDKPGFETLEKYILEEGYLDETEIGKQAHNMALRVIEQGLCNVPEYYGTECTLYYPGLYAGQTDLVGIHKGKDAIIDFKQTNKPKQREWIEDYFVQCAAYACMLYEMKGIMVKKFVIIMTCEDGECVVYEERDKKKYINLLSEYIREFVESKLKEYV